MQLNPSANYRQKQHSEGEKNSSFIRLDLRKDIVQILKIETPSLLILSARILTPPLHQLCKMSPILITFSSPRLNLINTVSGHSKSHSYYFPLESVIWNPPILVSQMTAEIQRETGHGRAIMKQHSLHHSLSQHIYKQRQSCKLKGHFCL